MKTIFFYETVIGRLGLVVDRQMLTNLYFPTDKFPTDLPILETATHLNAAQQLVEYLDGKRKIFQLNLTLCGTEFMQAVWRELGNIPYGQTVSYKYIAQNIGNAKAYRAVGLANNKNPLPIFIPCHRVIGTSGKLIGYRGGLTVKEYLLSLENVRFE